MTRRSAWTAIAGCTLPVALHVCMGLSVPWCAATVVMAATVLAAGAERRGAAIMLIIGLVTCARLLAAGPFAVPGIRPLLVQLAGIRANFIDRIALLLPEPQASFLAGLLTGERSGLPEDVAADMRSTGLTHILAVSGSNITLVLVVLDHLFFFVPRTWRTAPLAAGVVLFTLFCGAEASVVRACIMGILQLIALHAGRPSQSRLLIGWTFAGMLLWDPAQLADDAGFQLSFLAVIGLCEFQPLFQAMLRRVPRTLGLQEALVTTLAAQTTAGVWSAYVFGTLPLHAPLLNALVAPFIPVAMLTGAAAVLGGLVSDALGRLMMAPAWFALSVILRVGHEGARATAMILGGLDGSPVLLLGWLAALAMVHRASRQSAGACAILPADATARHPDATAAGRTPGGGSPAHP